MPRVPPRIVQESDPPTKKKFTLEEQEDQLKKEWEAMRIAMAASVMNWAELENALAKLLDVLIQPQSGGRGDVGLVIYNAPNNTETRFKIIDDVIMHKIAAEYHRVAIVQIWQKIQVTLNRYKNSRNNIVHGSTIEFEKLDGRIFVRHTALVNDVMAELEPWIKLTTAKGICEKMAAMRKLRTAQLPGMSAHDIADIAEKFDEMTETIEMFTDAMSLVTGFGHNYEASREKLLRVANHLKITDLQIDRPSSRES